MSDRPNIGTSMIYIHRSITRGLQVSVERSSEYIRQGYPDKDVHIGFLTYMQSLCWVINAHHIAEDRVIFPYLKTILPGAPVDKLSADHQKMDTVLNDIELAVEGMKDQEKASELMNVLRDALDRLAGIWLPHIGIEQRELYDSSLTETLMTDEEQIKLIRSASEVSMQQADPGYLLPFILYNLPEDDRTAMSRVLPPIMITEMIPVVWKNKWEPMKPFLLL
jgi:hemerythrin-like domain-containing protein